MNVTKEYFFKEKGAGQKSWEEFERLRNGIQEQYLMMENQNVEIIIKGQTKKVLMKTIEMNFAVSEHYEYTAERVGEGGQRGYETLNDYVELLKKGELQEPFDLRLGRKYYLGNFGEDYEGLQKVISFCQENGISIETHEREYQT